MFVYKITNLINGKATKYFLSIGKASQMMGTLSSIHKACNAIGKLYKNYQWFYLSDFMELKHEC